jgi:dUTP pyrophosphatase
MSPQNFDFKIFQFFITNLSIHSKFVQTQIKMSQNNSDNSDCDNTMIEERQKVSSSVDCCGEDEIEVRLVVPLTCCGAKKHRYVEVGVVLADNTQMPTKGSEEAAAFDIYSPETFTIEPRGTYALNSGLRFSIPKGNYIAIKSRSSLFKKGILTDGVVDSDYTGPITVVLHNLKDTPYTFIVGERVAQFILHPFTSDVVLVKINECDLKQTSRGSGGFGSTGK